MRLDEQLWRCATTHSQAIRVYCNAGSGSPLKNGSCARPIEAGEAAIPRKMVLAEAAVAKQASSPISTRPVCAIFAISGLTDLG